MPQRSARRRLPASPRAALFVAAALALGIGCVDVPDSVRAQFAEAGPKDRSNYRRGPHGLARPNEEPPAPKVAAADSKLDAKVEPAADADAAAPDVAADEDAAATTTTSAPVDGGAS